MFKCHISLYLLSLSSFINILSCHFLPLTVFPSASFCCHTLWERTICQGSSSPLFWSSPLEVGGLRELERGERPRWWAGGRADGGRYNGGAWWRDIRWRQHQTPDGLREVPGGAQVSLTIVVEFPNNTYKFWQLSFPLEEMFWWKFLGRWLVSMLPSSSLIFRCRVSLQEPGITFPTTSTTTYFQILKPLLSEPRMFTPIWINFKNDRR